MSLVTGLIWCTTISRETKLLLLDAGQSYEVEFLDRTGTESFCLFFSNALVREASTEVAAGRKTG